MLPPNPYVEAGPVVGLHNPPAIDLARAYTTVVGDLTEYRQVFPPDPRVETGPVVGLYNVPAIDLAGANT
jgi:hypothetical protein